MRILVTAGPTREYLDPVRFLSNASSGKLGYAIAADALRRGHRVELISGPVGLRPPRGAKVTTVVTSQEMFDAAAAIFPTCDAAVMAAAVCDYRPVQRSRRKLKKTGRGLSIALRPTRDIAAHLGRTRGSRVLVGFALESHDGRRNAESKLRRKRCDAVVLNGPEAIAADRTTVQILVGPHRWEPPFTAGKPQIARRVVQLVERLRREVAVTG